MRVVINIGKPLEVKVLKNKWTKVISLENETKLAKVLQDIYSSAARHGVKDKDVHEDIRKVLSVILCQF